MGTSAQCGHYVVHLRRDNKWYLYNDEKVVKVMEDLPTENAYMYLFKRLWITTHIKKKINIKKKKKKKKNKNKKKKKKKEKFVKLL